MSNINHKYYLSFSALGAVAQLGRIIEQLSDNTYLVEVTQQHGVDEFFFRVVSVQEMIGWRLYAQGYSRDNAVAEITEAYEKRRKEQEELNAEALAKKKQEEGDCEGSCGNSCAN